jgi:hypothetical protein
MSGCDEALASANAGGSGVPGRRLGAGGAGVSVNDLHFPAQLHGQARRVQNLTRTSGIVDLRARVSCWNEVQGCDPIQAGD